MNNPQAAMRAEAVMRTKSTGFVSSTKRPPRIFCAIANLFLLVFLSGVSGDTVPWGAQATVVKTGVDVPIRARVQIDGHEGDPAPTVSSGKPITIRVEIQSASSDVRLWREGSPLGLRLV